MTGFRVTGLRWVGGLTFFGDFAQYLLCCFLCKQYDMYDILCYRLNDLVYNINTHCIHRMFKIYRHLL